MVYIIRTSLYYMTTYQAALSDAVETRVSDIRRITTVDNTNLATNMICTGFQLLYTGWTCQYSVLLINEKRRPVVTLLAIDVFSKLLVYKLVTGQVGELCKSYVKVMISSVRMKPQSGIGLCLHFSKIL